MTVKRNSCCTTVFTTYKIKKFSVFIYEINFDAHLTFTFTHQTFRTFFTPKRYTAKRICNSIGNTGLSLTVCTVYIRCISQMHFLFFFKCFKSFHFYSCYRKLFYFIHSHTSHYFHSVNYAAKS